MNMIGFISYLERHGSGDGELVSRTLEPIVLLFGFCSSSWGREAVLKSQ